MRRFYHIVCLLALSASPAFAVEDSAAEPEDVGCAEEGPARKGVQKRDFLKVHRAELSAVGGFFAGDLLSTTYAYGGSLAFFITEDFGVEASLLIARFSLGIESPLRDFFMGQRFQEGNAYLVVGNLLWSPVHLKVRASERAILHGDLVFTLGAGDTIHDTVQGITVDAGLGIKFYLTRFLSLRFDVRDYLMIQEAVSIQRVVNNIVGTAGVSFWVLPWF